MENTKVNYSEKILNVIGLSSVSNTFLFFFITIENMESEIIGNIAGMISLFSLVVFIVFLLVSIFNKE